MLRLRPRDVRVERVGVGRRHRGHVGRHQSRLIGAPNAERNNNSLARRVGSRRPRASHESRMRAQPQYLARTAVALPCEESVNTPNGSLYSACALGNLQLTIALLDAGAHADGEAPLQLCGPSTTPLHVACEEGYADIATTLLAAGAGVHCRRDDGRTPLHLAAHAVVRCARGAEVMTVLLKVHPAAISATHRCDSHYDRMRRPAHWSTPPSRTALPPSTSSLPAPTPRPPRPSRRL